MKRIVAGGMVAAWLMAGSVARAGDPAVYQHSVLVENGSPARAFLWIPPDCRQVRAVVVGQNNMLEQGIFAHPAFRVALTRLGSTAFLDAVDGGSHNPPRWTGLPAGSPLGHATGGGPITVSRINGPVTKTGDDTFVVSLDCSSSTQDKPVTDVWLLTSQPGDGQYKSAVQQSLMKLPVNNRGADQHITFPEIADQKAGTATVMLRASSDAGVPVGYYVREGPAEVVGDSLRLTEIPPHSRFPVKVTVVAWQRGNDPNLKAAPSVERSFAIVK